MAVSAPEPNLDDERPAARPDCAIVRAQMLQTQERMAQAKRYFAWQARLVEPALGRRVLEVGCGVGSFTAQLLNREAVLATDATDDMVERTKSRTRGQTNLEVKTIDVMSPEFLRLRDWQANSCVAMNVLEHIEDDVKAVQQMSAVLAPGGRIFLFVPAAPGLYGPVDANLGHVRRYTKQGLITIAEQAGLSIETLRRINLAGFLAWWVNSKILKLRELPPGQIQFFDRFVAPWLERLERHFEPPFGLSLLLIANKKPTV